MHYPETYLYASFFSVLSKNWRRFTVALYVLVVLLLLLIAGNTDAAPLNIQKAPTTLSLNSSATTINYGQQPTLTVRSTGIISSLVYIKIKDDATELHSVPVNGDLLIMPIRNLSVGTHRITAVFDGDADNDPATSPVVTIVVNKAVSTAALTPSTSSAVFGASVTLNATITGMTPTGTVTFKDGTTTIGSATVSSGRASITTSSLSVGPHSLTAQYDGDANNANATSAIATVTMAQVTPSLALSSSATSLSYGAPVTLTANLTGGASATGNVRFMDGSTLLGTTAISGGNASLTTSSLATGNRSIIAIYDGDMNNASASSSPVAVTVGTFTASVNLNASATTANYGSSLTFTTSVTGNSPTGSVVFSEGSNILGTVSLVSGVASLNTSALTVGSHSLTAQYSGDANNSGARSAAVVVNIVKSSPTITLAASATSLNEKTPLNLTASLSGGVSPTGTVSFKDGSVTLGTVSLSGLTATLAVTSLTPGSHALTAVYNGDGNNNVLSSSVVTVAVASISPAVTVLSPATGAALGGTRVVISGAHLAGATAVSFGGSAARIVSNSDTELVVTTPAHGAGVVDVVISAATGAVTVASGFSYDSLPDPGKSAVVVAMVKAQTQAVHQFATAHLSNFTQRLESLRVDGWGQSSFGLSLGQTNSPSREPTNWARGGDVVNYQGSQTDYLRAGLRKTALGSATSQAAASEQDNNLPDLTQTSGEGLRRDVSWWISGALDLANQKGSGNQSGSRLSTSGISFGGDYRVNRYLSLGLGAGYSRSNYRADDDSASSTGQGFMGVAYASVRPLENLYVDIVAGYGALHFALARRIADTGVIANGARDGRQTFASTTVGYEWRGKDWLVSPYMRLDLARASLDRYTESGGVGALTYFRQSVRDDAAYLGLRGQFNMDVPVGVLTPQARVAYQHNLQGAGQASMTYADPLLASPVFSFSDSAQASKQWLLTLGGRLTFKNGTAMTLLYTHNAANSSTTSQSVNLSVNGRF